MTVALGCDHGGFELKETIKKHLEEKGFETKDFGCFGPDSVDYPDYAGPAAEAVAKGECDRGIVICTTGIGVSIVANKVPGVRCALCGDSTTAELTRLHNDSNMLALGAGIVGKNLALSIADTFLATEFSNDERHLRRISKIEHKK